MVTVDARGMRCPWPIVRLSRAMRDGAGTVRLLADDPRARPDALALAAEKGWRVEFREAESWQEIEVCAGDSHPEAGQGA